MMVDSVMVMRTPTEIAKRDGVSKQAVAKNIRKMVAEHDLPVERDSRDRIMRVSLAHYDHHRGMFANPAKVMPKDEGESEPLRSGDSFDEARRQNEWLKLTREKIRQAEEQGKLVRADLVEQALVSVGRTIQSEIKRLQNKADDIALAVSREGSSGARKELRNFSTELSQRIASALSEVAQAAPEKDDTLAEIEE